MKKYLLAIGLAVSLLVGAIAVPAGALVSAKHSVSNKKDGWVQFEAGSATLSKAAKSELRLFVKANKSATSFKVTGYVQKAGSDVNNAKLSKARAKSVRKYLRSLGVTVPITVKGAKVPKKSGSKDSARRAVIKAVKTSTPSPSPSVDSIGSISGTFQRNYYYDDCSDQRLDYVKLYEGNTLITTISEPAWSSTVNNNCEYAYTFQNVPNGTYTVEESFTQDRDYPWELINVEQPAWTTTPGARRDDYTQVHRSPDLVISSGEDITGIDLRMYNAD